MKPRNMNIVHGIEKSIFDNELNKVHQQQLEQHVEDDLNLLTILYLDRFLKLHLIMNLLKHLFHLLN
jgi:hypothetical protein